VIQITAFIELLQLLSAFLSLRCVCETFTVYLPHCIIFCMIVLYPGWQLGLGYLRKWDGETRLYLFYFFRSDCYFFFGVQPSFTKSQVDH